MYTGEKEKLKGEGQTFLVLQKEIRVALSFITEEKLVQNVFQMYQNVCV